MLELQDNSDYETYYMVADLHTINTPYDPKTFKEDVQEVVLDYLAAGLNPEKSTPGFSYEKFWQEVKNATNVYFLKYENLREDPFGELKKIIEFLEYCKNNDSINKTIDNHSFLKMKDIEKTKDERKRFARKGIAGDWKNNFNSDSKNLLKSKLGDILIEMGYEKDKNW